MPEERNVRKGVFQYHEYLAAGRMGIRVHPTKKLVHTGLPAWITGLQGRALFN